MVLENLADREGRHYLVEMYLADHVDLEGLHYLAVLAHLVDLLDLTDQLVLVHLEDRSGQVHQAEMVLDPLAAHEDLVGQYYQEDLQNLQNLVVRLDQ